MQPDSDPDRFGQALRAAGALRATLIALDDRPNLARVDRLLAELRRRSGHSASVVSLPITRERRADR